MWSSHAGARQGPALASLLLGAQEFSGRLAKGWARESASTDILDYDVIASGSTYLYGQSAQFAFGHGLTLAPAQWTRPTLEADENEIHVSVTLERDARTPAHEVVQVYASTDPTSYVGICGAVPRLRLAGAQVTAVPAAGAARVTLSIPWSRLRSWSDSEQMFTDVRQDVTIHLARSSASIVYSREIVAPTR